MGVGLCNLLAQDYFPIDRTAVDDLGWYVVGTSKTRVFQWAKSSSTIVLNGT